MRNPFKSKGTVTVPPEYEGMAFTIAPDDFTPEPENLIDGEIRNLHLKIEETESYNDSLQRAIEKTEESLKALHIQLAMGEKVLAAYNKALGALKYPTGEHNGTGNSVFLAEGGYVSPDSSAVSQAESVEGIANPEHRVDSEPKIPLTGGRRDSDTDKLVPTSGDMFHHPL